MQLRIGFLAVLTALAATVAPATAQNYETSVTRRPYSNYEARLSLDRTQYPSNRAVGITMTITNVSRQRAVLTPGRNRLYDYSIRDVRTNRIVYQMSRNRPAGNNENFALLPDESRTYRELWDQRDDAGKPVPSGTYAVEARIFPQGAVSTQFFLSGQGGGGNRPDPQPGPGNPPTDPGNPPTRPGLYSATLTADRMRVQPGQSVRLTYTVTNPTRQPTSMRFASGKQFEMSATNARGQRVWLSSEGRFYTDALTFLALGPGERKVYSETWTVPANVAPGSYRVIASLTPMGNAAVATAVATIVVVGRGADNGWDDGEGGRPGRPGPARVVSLRDLINDGRKTVGQRVTVSGVYLGRQGGYGGPPVTRNDWVLASEGVSIYVTGPDDGGPTGRNRTVTGTVRTTPDGRLYLSVN